MCEIPSSHTPDNYREDSKGDAGRTLKVMPQINAFTYLHGYPNLLSSSNNDVCV